jgi:hypothetical protein
VKTVYYTFDKYYQENENRYSVYDYRDGYTPRISREYLEKKYDSERRNYYADRHLSRDSGKVVYYEYSPYMRAYEEKTCYDSEPRGKLLYIKCDF